MYFTGAEIEAEEVKQLSQVFGSDSIRLHAHALNHKPKLPGTYQ